MMQLAVLIFLYRFCRILVVMEPLRSFNIAVSFPVWGFSRSLYISVILEHFLSMRLKNVASLWIVCGRMLLNSMEPLWSFNIAGSFPVWGLSLSLSLYFEKAIFLKCLKLVRNLDGFSSSKFYFRNLPHNLLLRIWAVKNCTFWHQLISEQGLYTCLFDLPCNLPSICGDF